MGRIKTIPTALLTLAAIVPGAITTGTIAAADDGVVVNGTGHAVSPPDRLEMAVTLTGSAEMAGDAVTKYRGQRERFLEAIKALGIEDLKTRSGTMQVSQASAGNPNQRVVINGVVQQQTAGSTFNITETMALDMPAGEESLAAASRLYDLGRDLSVTFVPPGGTSLVEPKFTKQAEAEEKAMSEAMDAARAEAKRVAKLAGRELGRVEAVEVLSVPRPTNSRTAQQMAYAMAFEGSILGQPDFGEGGEDTGDGGLTQQTTTVRLKVRFSFAD